MHFPLILDQYIGNLQKLSKKERPRVVVGPFSFITNSCIHQIHVHQIKVPEKMLMLAWILHGKIRKKIGALEDNIFQLITHDLVPLFSVGSVFWGGSGH